MRESMALGVAMTLLLAIGGMAAFAEIPPHMNIQGRLTDDTGAPLPPGPKIFIFKIYNSPTGGTELWPGIPGQEEQVVETDDQGLWTAHVGAIIPIPIDLLLNPAAWLEIAVGFEGTWDTLPRTQMLSGPYSFHSQICDEAMTSYSAAPFSVGSDAIIDGTIGFEDIGQNEAGPGQVMKWSGTDWVAAEDDVGTGNDEDWYRVGGVLYSGDEWGLARAGNVLHGSYDSTHVNWGVACTTGTAGFNDWYVTVGGGVGNASKGAGATIAGGFRNYAHGSGATVGGGINNHASDTQTVVGGGEGNRASRTGATVAGGGYNYARGYYSTVCGGGGAGATDSNAALGEGSAIGGGINNRATGMYSKVGGGDYNTASQWSATVAGGHINTADGLMATVGGGSSNFAVGDYTTVSGGVANEARAGQATVGGGNDNDATASSATISGGYLNKATAFYASIGGGSNNQANGRYSAIGGGETDTASGDWSCIPGGRHNAATGDYSFAAGRRAKAIHDGSFVWADSTDADFESFTSSEFAIRATQGLRANADNASYGATFNNYGNGDGVRAIANASQGNIWGALYAENTGTSPAIYAYSSDGDAAYLDGSVHVSGYLTKAGGGFKIDHPLNPENEYLYHSFVESPDMKNVYDGIATLDANGESWVQLPDWCEALNRDFRYQLTCMGGYAPVYIAEKITENRFKIAGGNAGLEVCWQVTGIRQDAFANANRIPVEEMKTSAERGYYLHPKAFGQPESRGIDARAMQEKTQTVRMERQD